MLTASPSLSLGASSAFPSGVLSLGVLGASGASPAAATPSSLVSSPLALVEEEKVEDSAEDLFVDDEKFFFRFGCAFSPDLSLLWFIAKQFCARDRIYLSNGHYYLTTFRITQVSLNYFYFPFTFAVLPVENDTTSHVEHGRCFQRAIGNPSARTASQAHANAVAFTSIHSY